MCAAAKTSETWPETPKEGVLTLLVGMDAANVAFQVLAALEELA